MSVPETIRKKLGVLPHKPGIYLMRDRFGTVIYVGKARDLRKRVSHYFQPSRRLGWDLKFRALIEAICDFDFHVVRSEPESLLLESKLIKEFHPRYNVSFRDDKRFLMLKVNLNDPIPRFTLTRLKQDDGARYFGPFPDSGALRSTLALVRRQFHLRGCRPLTPTERDYRHCLYAHLKYCTAPCIANVTRDQYLDQVRAACDFLAGQCDEMQERLDAEMKKAAANQDYERAADLARSARRSEKVDAPDGKIRAHPLQPAAGDRSGKGPGRARRSSRVARAAAAHRGVRHFQHQRHVRRGLPGAVQKRPAGSRELPAVQNQNRGRPGRFRVDGGSRAAALHAAVE